MKKMHIIENAETQTLYADIERVYGGWIKTTGGDPFALNDLEEVGADAEIAKINTLLNADGWEDCDADDIEYINETLADWGI